MLNRITILSLAVALISLAPSLSAQSLSKEVEVDHDIVPEHRDVSRINFTPSVSLPALPTKNLNYSMRGFFTPSQPVVATINPPADTDSIFDSPYRGYASLGFMPIFNGAASAGYKFVDNDRTRLTAWMQYDGTAYRTYTAPLGETGRRYMRSHTATLATALHQALGTETYLDLGLDYTYAHFNTPTPLRGLQNQGAQGLNFDASLTGTYRTFDYRLRLGYSRFAFLNKLSALELNFGPIEMTPARENVFAGEVEIGRRISDTSRWSVEAGYSTIAPDVANSLCNRFSGETHSLLRLTPRYRVLIGSVRADLGLRFDFSFNDGKTFHIAPDLLLSWTPVKPLTVFFSATGGQWQNPLSYVYGTMPHSVQAFNYGNSQVVIDACLGISGAWRGFHGELSAAYANADDWLVPAIFSIYSPVLAPASVEGCKIHAMVGYTYRSLATLDVAFDIVPGGESMTWYRWHDGARRAFSARLSLTPIKHLAVDLAYELRTGRRMLNPDINLHRSSILKARASYAITPQWTAFISGENLLNCHYELTSCIPAQGITGLIGASYKF